MTTSVKVLDRFQTFHLTLCVGDLDHCSTFHLTLFEAGPPDHAADLQHAFSATFQAHFWVEHPLESSWATVSPADVMTHQTVYIMQLFVSESEALLSCRCQAIKAEWVRAIVHCARHK